jgi:predicted nucleic acid-binding protein
VPLVVHEAATEDVRVLYEADPALLVWWATPVEVASAVARLEREGALDSPEIRAAFHRLDLLASTWSDLQPGDAIRRIARRLVRAHPLRAADALQLAAALVSAEGEPESLTVVSLDGRLLEAAEREGLSVATC